MAAGGYSIWDLMTGKPMRDAAQGAAEAVGHFSTAGINPGAPRTIAGPRMEEKWGYPILAPNVDQNLAEAKKESKQLKERKLEATREAERERVRKTAEESRKALHRSGYDPDFPPSYSRQTLNANQDAQMRFGDEKDRFGKWVGEYDEYHQQILPNWKGREPFTPIPGVPRTPPQNQNPFQHGMSPGPQMAGFGMSPQQTVLSRQMQTYQNARSSGMDHVAALKLARENETPLAPPAQYGGGSEEQGSSTTEDSGSGGFSIFDIAGQASQGKADLLTGAGGGKPEPTSPPGRTFDVDSFSPLTLDRLQREEERKKYRERMRASAKGKSRDTKTVKRGKKIVKVKK